MARVAVRCNGSRKVSCVGCEAHTTVKIGAVCSYKTLVSTKKSTQCYYPEDKHRQVSRLYAYCIVFISFMCVCASLIMLITYCNKFAGSIHSGSLLH
jgi:hypothetical protein